MRDIDKQLIDVAISEIIIAYNLPLSFADILKNNIIKRVQLYEGNEVPQTSETKIIRKIDSLALFFLNRLLNNIRSYSIDTKLDLSGNTGIYSSFYQTLDLKSRESIRKMITRVLKNRVDLVSEDVVDKMVEKVIDREVGHALQTSFSGAVGTNDETFKRLVDSLNQKYFEFFNSYTDLGNEPLIEEKDGMKVCRKDDEFSDARDYYAPNAYLTHIDEIFNEDEVLYVAGITTPQMNYSVGGVLEKEIYNYDSSYYRITSYSRMMKIILGKNDTFKSMYEDSIILYATIDQFQNEAREVFSAGESLKLTPMMEVFGRLDTVRGSRLDKNVIPQAYELDLFFTKCLKTIVDRILAISDINDESLDLMIATVLEFKKCLMISKYQELSTHKLCNDMIQRLLAKKKEKTSSEIYNVGIYDEYISVADRICEAIDLQDDISFKRLLDELNNLEARVRITFQKEVHAMTYDEKIQFFLFNMKKSLINKVADAYRYYRSNLMNLKSGRLFDEEITPKF